MLKHWFRKVYVPEKHFIWASVLSNFISSQRCPTRKSLSKPNSVSLFFRCFPNTIYKNFVMKPPTTDIRPTFLVFKSSCRLPFPFYMGTAGCHIYCNVFFLPNDWLTSCVAKKNQIAQQVISMRKRVTFYIWMWQLFRRNKTSIVFRGMSWEERTNFWRTKSASRRTFDWNIRMSPGWTHVKCQFCWQKWF